MITVLTMKLYLPTGGLRGIRKAVWGGGVALRGIAGDGRGGGGGVVSGEPRTGVRGCEAGEPECGWPACIRCIDSVAMRLVCRQFVSREDAKPRRERQWPVFGFQFSVFGLASRGRESAGVRPVSLCVSCPPAFVALILWRCGWFAGSWSYAKPRSREGKGSGQFSVFGFRFGEPRTGVRGCEDW